MDRSYPYSRRLARRMQLQRRVAAVAAVGAAGCAILYAATAPIPAPALAPAGKPAPPALAAGSTDVDGKPAARRVYPYSVVPGGVSGVRELGRVLREDKVVAAHYAEFDITKAHERTVDKPRAVHVSYRKGDKVYWTAKKVMLAEGETLLSDGTHEARARCANRISDTPRLPVEAHGPSEEELDAAVLDDGAEGSLANVSFALPDDDGEGRPGGFLNAPGNGRAGAIQGGGADANTGASALFGAGAAGPAQGAYLTRRTAGVRSGSGEAGSAPGSETAPAGGGSAGGSPGGSAGSTNPVADDGQAPGDSATPQPGTPSAPQQPGNGGGPTPGSPGETPNLPNLPNLPDLPVIPVPGVPGGGQDTDPLPGVPAPPTDIGTVPAPGGTPGGSPLPDPTLTPPGPPVPPALPDREEKPPAEVPEPASLWLFGVALAALLVQRYRAARRR